MTAYEVIPVGTRAERERSQQIEVLPYSELLEQRDLLAADAAGWEALWRAEVNLRIRTQNRLSRAMRVLASLGRLSPRMADLVAAAGREIWQLDRDDRQRQSRSARKAREIGDLP